MYLQDKLGLLPVSDTYLVKSSNTVIDFLKRGFQAFSIDIKDLYYSLTHGSVVSCIERCIDEFGDASFRGEARISCINFFNLLELYLKSTSIAWDRQYFFQKSGVCIGYCLAPILSDLLLSRLDRDILLQVQGTAVFMIFRYIRRQFSLFLLTAHQIVLF